jgi:hypothetical protein
VEERVKELHCIMPIENIPSVMRHGILSHALAGKTLHASVAAQEVQDRRHGVRVPGGLRLHEYANLYFHARNPMLYKRKDRAEELCILMVSTKVLQLPGVVITDQNAATSFVRFLAPNQWQELNWNDIYARYWSRPGGPTTLEEQVADRLRKARKCAEVLVPQRVEPGQLIGAYIVDVAARGKMEAAGFGLPMFVSPDMYFR